MQLKPYTIRHFRLLRNEKHIPYLFLFLSYRRPGESALHRMTALRRTPGYGNRGSWISMAQ
jgi:hypothetical protein